MVYSSEYHTSLGWEKLVSTWIVIYVLVGLFFVVLESRTSHTDYSEMSRLEALLVMGSVMIHYFRLSVTYPAYVAEDVLLWASNKVQEEGQ